MEAVRVSESEVFVETKICCMSLGTVTILLLSTSVVVMSENRTISYSIHVGVYISSNLIHFTIFKKLIIITLVCTNAQVGKISQYYNQY